MTLKLLCYLLWLAVPGACAAQAPKKAPATGAETPIITGPDALYRTAAHTDYLSEEEKQIFYYLNLARLQPVLFADSILKNYRKPNAQETELSRSANAAGLYQELKNRKPVGALQPDKTLYDLARCFAEASGKSGAVGHVRAGTNCAAGFAAECCAYGRNKALDIVMQLLIDEGVPSLAHRKICLGPYSRLGVSIQPHKEYRFNAVLDFK